MSRVDKGGITRYTIGEKIAYFQEKLRQGNLTKRKENDIRQRLQSLQNIKRKYGVVYMEDDRFFKKPQRDGHHYFISEIDRNDDIGANRISHSKGGIKLRNSFDKQSRVQRDTLRYDRSGKRLNANDAYPSNLSDKVDSRDIGIIENRRKK